VRKAARAVRGGARPPPLAHRRPKTEGEGPIAKDEVARRALSLSAFVSAPQALGGGGREEEEAAATTAAAQTSSAAFT
jgi:hypothetical protein